MANIYFDMDGTIADLYGVEGWLDYLLNSDTTPYDEAEVMLNMSLLARYLHKVQAMGHSIGIISWTSKNGTDLYNGEVAAAKMTWLHKHLPSVTWDEIHIINYGTPKTDFMQSEDDILFDDEEKNRTTWGETAYEPDLIFKVLKDIIQGI